MITTGSSGGMCTSFSGGTDSSISSGSSSICSSTMNAKYISDCLNEAEKNWPGLKSLFLNFVIKEVGKFIFQSGKGQFSLTKSGGSSRSSDISSSNSEQYAASKCP